MVKKINERINVKYSEVYEDYEEYVYVTKYIDLARNDFYCDEIYNVLLGENDGNCELCFDYDPVLREYSIDFRPEYGGAVCLIKHCPWCGSKFPSPLRDKFFDILEKECGIETDIGECGQREDIPPEFRSDEWWKKRKL